MAKKKGLANPMAGFDAKPTKKTSRILDNPLESVIPTDVRKALNRKGKDTTMAGRYLRRSILVLPEMDEAMNRKARELGVGKMELVRYLLAAGLEQLNRGEEPEKKEVVTVRLEMPHWQE